MRLAIADPPYLGRAYDGDGDINGHVLLDLARTILREEA